MTSMINDRTTIYYYKIGVLIVCKLVEGLLILLEESIGYGFDYMIV